MKRNQIELIEELIQITQRALVAIKHFENQPLEELNYKVDSSSWSVLECIEHLIFYSKYYLPEIEKGLLASYSTNTQSIYKSSILGDYFISSVMVNNNKKYKALKNMTPTESEYTYETLKNFTTQLEQLLSFLEQAKGLDLTKAKTAISFTKLLKLRLGDTIRFNVYHNERHIAQAERALNLAKEKNILTKN